MTEKDKDEYLYEIARDIAHGDDGFRFIPAYRREEFIERIKDDIKDVYVFEDEEEIED